ncbi:MAG: peptidase [Dongiaceae bacterium]
MAKRSLLLAMALLPLLGSPAGAASDQQRAREALQAGEILPLGAILSSVNRQVEGRVLNAWLEKNKHGWIYRLKLLDRDGNIVGVVADARTGEVLQVFAPRH